MQPWRRLLIVCALLALVSSARAVDEPEGAPAKADEAAEDEAVPSTEGEAAAEAEVESVAVEESEPEEEAAADAGEAAVDEEEPVPIDEGHGATPAAAARAGASSVQWVVTHKMRMQLSKLGYSEEEIGQLEPERAAAIIRRSITRPTRGVPAGWNRGKRQQPAALRSAVSFSRSVVAKARKTFSDAPGGPVAPAVALASVAGALTLGLARGGGGGGSRSALVERAVAPSAPEDGMGEGVEGGGSDELWLDRQIDKLIAFLKDVLGK